VFAEVVGLSGSVKVIVNSLLRPFVGRYIGNKGRVVSPKEQIRMVRSMCKTAQRIHAREDQLNTEQDYVKYWTDSYLAKAFKSDLPVVDDRFHSAPLFVSWFGRFIARSLVKGDVSFLYSLQKGTKQAWEPLGRPRMLKSLKGHQERLGTDHGNVPEDLVRAIELTSSEVYEGLTQRPMEKMIPSGSACLQRSRHSGGALKLYARPTHFRDLWKSEMARRIGRLPAIASTVDDWRQKTFESAIDEALANMPGNEQHSSLNVGVQAIPEPGKFRIITKGCGYLYTALQPLQGQMLSCWKRHGSSSMRHADLTERVREVDDRCKECDVWVSVDYEAATDLIKQSATLLTMSSLKEHPLYELAIASMKNNVAEYTLSHDAIVELLEWQVGHPKEKMTSQHIVQVNEKHGIKSHVTRDGDVASVGWRMPIKDAQLMGHPLSFTALCIVNLAVYKVAVMRWLKDAIFNGSDREFLFRERVATKMYDNVIVNGDDMLFKCPRSFVPVFNRAVLDAGFKLSAGKNYVSNDFAMINSQVFRRRLGKMVRVGYLNQRLLTGNNIKTGESAATPVGVSRDLNQMFELLGNALFLPMAMKRFPAFSSKAFQPNWFAPVHLGGCGIDPKWSNGPVRFTRTQRIVARKFLRCPTTLYYLRGGPTLPVNAVPNSVSHFRPVFGDYVPQNFEVQMLDDGWMSRIALLARISGQMDKVGSVAMRNIVLWDETQNGRRRKINALTQEEMDLFRSVRWFGTPGPVCPDLRPLLVPEVLVAEKDFEWRSR